MTGHLHLVCAANGHGSYLREQSFRAPMHLSKPYREGGELVVNAVNATAGLFAGDQVAIDIRAETGAALLLTSPSANRVHRMTGGFAAHAQHFSVASSAFLEILPQLLIPHRGASYRQTTTVRIEHGAELLLFDLLAPGRVASGECFEFSELRWATDIRCGRRHVFRERFSLMPETPGLLAIRQRFPTAYFGSCVASSARFRADAECWQRVNALQSDAVWIGSSSLGGESYIVKWIAGNSLEFARVTKEVRRLLRAAMQREDVAPRQT